MCQNDYANHSCFLIDVTQKRQKLLKLRRCVGNDRVPDIVTVKLSGVKEKLANDLRRIGYGHNTKGR